MPQPKIYAAVLNHFGSLSDLAATLGATVVDETLCFSGLTGQAVSDLMEQHGLDYNYSGTPEAAKEADQSPHHPKPRRKSHVRTAKPIDRRSGRDH